MNSEAINRGYAALAEAVIIQACREAKQGKREAQIWLQSETAQLWADELDIAPIRWTGYVQRIQEHANERKRTKKTN